MKMTAYLLSTAFDLRVDQAKNRFVRKAEKTYFTECFQRLVHLIN